MTPAINSRQIIALLEHIIMQRNIFAKQPVIRMLTIGKSIFFKYQSVL